jgi:hypothetical protein
LDEVNCIPRETAARGAASVVSSIEVRVSPGIRHAIASIVVTAHATDNLTITPTFEIRRMAIQ